MVVMNEVRLLGVGIKMIRGAVTITHAGAINLTLSLPGVCKHKIEKNMNSVQHPREHHH